MVLRRESSSLYDRGEQIQSLELICVQVQTSSLDFCIKPPTTPGIYAKNLRLPKSQAVPDHIGQDQTSTWLLNTSFSKAEEFDLASPEEGISQSTARPGAGGRTRGGFKEPWWIFYSFALAVVN